MKSSNDYDSMLWELLAKERLADLSQFHRPHFFDEVPLYSRVSDLSFLADQDADEASVVLLRFSLKYLKSVISYEQHRVPFFAAITVWSSPEGEPVVPNLFVWSDSVRKLSGQLTLHVAKTPFGRKIKRLISKMRVPDRLEVLEDTSTTPDLSRVFIGLAQPPCQSMVALDTFRKPIRAAKP